MKKLTVCALLGILTVLPASGEDFFSKADQAVKIARKALKNEGIDPDTQVVVKHRVQPAPSGPLSPRYQAIYEDFGMRKAWQINFNDKATYRSGSEYIVSYYVLVFSETEAAVVIPE